MSSPAVSAPHLITEPAFDARAFRTALGGFATGVCVVTALDLDAGCPVGITVNSFASVSLDPPLVLWSIGRTAHTFEVFRRADQWAINILAADQQEVSNRFASRADDKFAGVEWTPGLGGAPLLDGCVARFQCVAEHRYDGGDHLILVGRVLAFDRAERAPLLFAQGRYGKLAE